MMERLVAAMEKMDANQEEFMANLDAHQERMIAKMDASIEGLEACVGRLQANRENSDAVAKHQEVPNEEAEVETVGALKDRYGDWHLAVGRGR
jgi:hypothetical protein